MNIPTIRVEELSPIFTKFHIDSLPFDAVLHKFTQKDEGDPHDHPFSFQTHILKGGYVERVWKINSDGTWHTSLEYRYAGTSHKVYTKDIHKIIDLFEDECWTLILPEKWEQKSGFYRFDENGVKFRYWDEENFREI